MTALAANLFPALTAGLLLIGLLGPGPLTPARLCLAFGGGYVIGAPLTGVLGWLTLLLPWQATPIPAAAGLLAVAAGGAVLALRRPQGIEAAPPVTLRPMARAAWWLLLALLLLGLALAAAEAMTRPIYPWDAWSAWSVKTRVWLELGPHVDFVSVIQWLTDRAPDQYTSEAWGYPELIPRFQLWVLWWQGAWTDATALSPWLFAGAAMLAFAYGVVRELGGSPIAAMAIAFVIGSIPILNVQVALPGMMDLWLAGQLMAFCGFTLLWLTRRELRWLALALACLAAAAGTKLEGLVWALFCLPVLIMSATDARLRLGFLALVALASVLWLAMGGFDLTVLGDIRFAITPEEIAMPYLGVFRIDYSSQWPAFGKTFLALPNWHLVGYLLLPACAWAIWRFRDQPEGRGLATFAVMGLGFLFVLFFLTHAAIWAQSATASNRLALHFVPGCLLWCGLLLARDLATEGSAAAAASG
ncbi:MAG: hypothetical protein AAGA23_08915 [Pseudomonadota bacterium]